MRQNTNSFKNKLLKTGPLESYVSFNTLKDVKRLAKKKLKKVGTDFFMFTGGETDKNKNGYYYLKNKKTNFDICGCIAVNGEFKTIYKSSKIGFCPTLSLKIPSEEEAENYKIDYYTKTSIFDVFRKKPLIRLGSYPQNEVSKNLRYVLEKKFNNGDLDKSLVATGKTYSKILSYNSENMIGICPEFEFEGKKYVRSVLNYKNKSYNPKMVDKPIWFEVKEIDFVIKNWNEMPKFINPKGNGKAKSMELESDKILFAGMIPNATNSFDIDWFLNNRFLDEMLGLQNAKVYKTSKYEYSVPEYAFDGCTNFEKIVLSSHTNYIYKNAFKNCKFSYIYKNKFSKNIILSKTMPDKKNIEKLICLDDLLQTIENFDLCEIFKNFNLELGNDYTDEYLQLTKKLKKEKLSIPYEFTQMLIKNDYFKDFVGFDFRFLKNEISNLDDILKFASVDEKKCFYDFATFLGCFSDDKWLDKNGKPTNVLVCQKACTLLNQCLKTKILDSKLIYYLLAVSDEDICINSIFSQDFLKFISNKGKNGKFDNLQMLINMEDNQRGSFVFAIKNFEIAKMMRKTFDQNGRIIMLSWKEVFEKLKITNIYSGVNSDNFELAHLFKQRGFDQEIFDEASKLYQRAKKDGVKHDILDIHLDEKNLISDIEKMQNNTKEVLNESLVLVDENYKDVFTYEMLDKYDPRNSIIGLYCDCCASITRAEYGGDIAKASITAHDIQNLVVKNARNEIIAKGTMYVNKELGYAVINEFDIAAIYKKGMSGYSYYDELESDTSASRERNAIFSAFMRGIKAFVKEYDKENPQKPLQAVAVGMGYNKLQAQCKRYEIITQNLKVPSRYKFADAAIDNQYILYKKEKNNLNINSNNENKSNDILKEKCYEK